MYMAQFTTSAAILARLFARLEGFGALQVSVPGSMLGLAEACQAVDLDATMQRPVLRGGRWVVEPRPEAVESIRDVRRVPGHLLRQDRVPLMELLNRVAASGEETRPLLGEEMGYLQHCIGHGAWCKGISIVE